QGALEGSGKAGLPLARRAMRRTSWQFQKLCSGSFYTRRVAAALGVVASTRRTPGRCRSWRARGAALANGGANADPTAPPRFFQPRSLSMTSTRPHRIKAVTMTESERAATLIAGGLLALYGLGRGDRTGIALGLMGSGIALSGWNGTTSLHEWLDVHRFDGAGSDA